MTCLGIVNRPSKWWKLWDIREYYKYRYTNPNNLNEVISYVETHYLDERSWEEKDKFLSMLNDVGFWYTGGYGKHDDA